MSILISPEKAVALLVKHLANAVETMGICEDDPIAERIKKIEDGLNDLKLVFPGVKKWEQKLLDDFIGLYRCLRKLDLDGGILDQVDENISKIKSSVSTLQQLSLSVTAKATADERRVRFKSRLSDLSVLEEKILVDPALRVLQVSYYDNLDPLELRLCLLFLSVFPENQVIKKRPLIYLWIGEGLIKSEKDGEDFFLRLLEHDLIKPSDDENYPFVNKFKVHPWIRYMLISLARNAWLFDFDFKGMPLFNVSKSRRACLVMNPQNPYPENRSNSNFEHLRTIINVNENYLHFDYEWIERSKRLVVLHLGRWQNSPNHHIEVQSEKFLEALRTQKHLKYLSLRGISRITTLPSSIVELVSLEILDLKACHHLETLPDDVSSLKKLTHLDVSECYLLERMPKGLEELTCLQVLKGFIIGNSNKTPCRIGDLARLENLERLSIHIGSEAVIKDHEFEQMENLQSVWRLKISWGVSPDRIDKKVLNEPFAFPPFLKKLVLEGIPHEQQPTWLTPSKLKVLTKLCIKGGKLNSLDHWEDSRCTVEI